MFSSLKLPDVFFGVATPFADLFLAKSKFQPAFQDHAPESGSNDGIHPMRLLSGARAFGRFIFTPRFLIFGHDRGNSGILQSIVPGSILSHSRKVWTLACQLTAITVLVAAAYCRA